MHLVYTKPSKYLKNTLFVFIGCLNRTSRFSNIIQLLFKLSFTHQSSECSQTFRVNLGHFQGSCLQLGFADVIPFNSFCKAKLHVGLVGLCCCHSMTLQVKHLNFKSSSLFGVTLQHQPVSISEGKTNSRVWEGIYKCPPSLSELVHCDSMLPWMKGSNFPSLHLWMHATKAAVWLVAFYI